MFRTGTGDHKANLITAGLQMEHERTDADADVIRCQTRARGGA